MKPLIIPTVLVIIWSISCESSSQNKNQIDPSQGTRKAEPIRKNLKSKYDSVRNAVIDTSTLLGRRIEIRKQFILESESYPTYDTLFDINYDGFEDFIIGFYYSSGTGLKNGVRVYLLTDSTQGYALDSTLSRITNPSFYIDDMMITGFYLPHGAGWCEKHEWIDGDWVVTKEIFVSNDGENSIWYFHYPLTDRADSVTNQYVDVPPMEFLRHEYAYGEPMPYYQDH